MPSHSKAEECAGKHALVPIAKTMKDGKVVQATHIANQKITVVLNSVRWVEIEGQLFVTAASLPGKSAER